MCVRDSLMCPVYRGVLFQGVLIRGVPLLYKYIKDELHYSRERKSPNTTQQWTLSIHKEKIRAPNAILNVITFLSWLLFRATLTLLHMYTYVAGTFFYFPRCSDTPRYVCIQVYTHVHVLYVLEALK